jgi:hypothetical protein
LKTIHFSFYFAAEMQNSSKHIKQIATTKKQLGGG